MELADMYRQGRHKAAENALNGADRNTPDTEETKDMVYTESVKITAHLLKAALPPVKAIFLHLLPVVSRESPVLSFHSKIIRWCSGLHIHMEKVRLLPGISTITC